MILFAFNIRDMLGRRKYVYRKRKNLVSYLSQFGQILLIFKIFMSHFSGALDQSVAPGTIFGRDSLQIRKYFASLHWVEVDDEAGDRIADPVWCTQGLHGNFDYHYWEIWSIRVTYRRQFWFYDSTHEILIYFSDSL